MDTPELFNIPIPTLQKRLNRNIRYKFRFDGKQLSVSSGTKNISKASNRKHSQKLVLEKINEYIRDQERLGRVPNELRNEDDEKLISRALIDFESLALENTSEEQKANIMNVLRHMKKCLEESSNGRIKYLDDITVVAFENAVPLLKKSQAKKKIDGEMILVGKEISKKFWSEKKSYFNRFFSWQISRGLMNENPARTLPRVVNRDLNFKSREDCWPDKTFFKVAELLPEEESEALYFMRFAALDLIDLYQIKAEHIIPPRGKKEKFWWIKKRRGKANGGIQEVPVDTRYLEEIVKNRYKKAKKSEVGFLFNFSNRMSKATFSHHIPKKLKFIFETILKKRPLLSKSLRHTFATFWSEVKNGRHRTHKKNLKSWMGLSPSSTMLDRYYDHNKTSSDGML